ncbi:hypothetical protein GOODEAATRI_015299 [Goodea atripinnis]|uniref:Uncharacterized protein n=1 Tax=Goodea atripinnis TaxID=208336 RepID=A0ABV0P5K7_9TELE
MRIGGRWGLGTGQVQGLRVRAGVIQVQAGLVVPPMVLLEFLCSGGPLDVYGMDLLRICPRSRGAGLWLLTLAIAYLYGETCIHKRTHTQTHRCLDSGVNRYTNVLY